MLSDNLVHDERAALHYARQRVEKFLNCAERVSRHHGKAHVIVVGIQLRNDFTKEQNEESEYNRLHQKAQHSAVESEYLRHGERAKHNNHHIHKIVGNEYGGKQFFGIRQQVAYLLLLVVALNFVDLLFGKRKIGDFRARHKG